MTGVYRLRYAGVCEIWVEAQGGTISKVLAASGESSLVGHQLDDLPKSAYVDTTLMAEYDAPGPPGAPVTI